MPNYKSNGGNWKLVVPAAKIEEVKKEIEQIEKIVKPITKSKAKKGRPKKAR